MILVDTDVLIEILDKRSEKGDEALSRIEESGEEVAVSALTMHEALYGVRKYGKTSTDRIQLLEVIPFGRAEAVLSSEIELRCEMKGRKIPRVDSMIAATAMSSGAKLFTYDRHFEDIEGLALF
jgi:tRNA(fMet)-specific endonuclease VapC